MNAPLVRIVIILKSGIEQNMPSSVPENLVTAIVAILAKRADVAEVLVVR